ncbi:MAG: hypothetical protein JXA14_24150 [Anaerolineae bacterium]|nr:hypothetical protein [Anaerolineae bacterium]
MMQRIAVDQIFETSDLYLAAYLLTRGLRLWATDAHDPARVIFVLTPPPQPADLSAYTQDRAEVNVSEFGRALRTLKKALWRAKDGRR